MRDFPHLVGMIHLFPLPGSPRFAGSFDEVLEIAAADAAALREAGFPALIVENFGDAPFFADQVPPETIAAMTSAVLTVIESARLPVGVNVLRNDALGALAVAAATGASIIRVNVLTGVMYTDQGPIVGKAAEIARKRRSLMSDVAIWSDVMVKHATSPPGVDARQAAIDTVERGSADALIVSGGGTGSAPGLDHLKAVRAAVGQAVRIVIGSGATPANLSDLHSVADTVIAGSYTKIDGRASNRVDPSRATAMVAEAGRVGLI